MAAGDSLGLEEALRYEEKIRRLEDSVSGLRMSRRILMSLLEQNQQCLRAELERFQRENSRLRKQVTAYAHQIWELKQRLPLGERLGD